MQHSSVRTRSRLARRLSWLVVASLTSAALFAPGAAGTAMAAEVAPNANDVELIVGNPKCAEDQDKWFKIDGAPSNGTAGDGLIVISNATSTSFDWAIAADYLDEYDMSAVIVKAGDNALVYFYADASDDSDTNLQSPLNNGQQQAAISHVEFCFDKKPEATPTPEPTIEPTPEPTVEPTPEPTVEPTPEPTVEPTPEPTVEPTPEPTEEPNPTPEPTEEPNPTPEPTEEPSPTATETPTGGVGGATGTPSITLPPTDALGTASMAPAGDGWRVILLAMAGLMAAALLLTPASAVVRKDEDR